MGYVFEFAHNIPDYRPRAEDDDDAIARVEEKIRARHARDWGRASAEEIEILTPSDDPYGDPWVDNGDGSRRCTLYDGSYDEFGTLFWFPAKLTQCHSRRVSHNTVHVRT